ncbi:hypothetical protein [Rossellomorea sp. NPDC077527]|uniref:hypothetical protein n=1 Tax=Rossellomorea sp. NPDC077527 TaxID=3364510 RepID=UPI0037CBE096
MKKKLFFTLLFLLLSSCIGYLFTLSSMSMAHKIKSHFSVEEKVMESDAPPVNVNSNSKWEEWNGELPKWRVLYRIIGGPDLVADFRNKGGSRKKAAIGAIVLVLLLLYFLAKRRKKHRDESQENVMEQRTPLPKTDVYEEDIPEPLSFQDLDEVRVLLIKWEQRLSASQKKRHHETLSEWFKRIEGPTEIIPIYDKVRYGLLRSSKEEYQFVKEQFFSIKVPPIR